MNMDVSPDGRRIAIASDRDPKTLNEIGNHPRARLPFWFEEGR